MVEVFSSWKTRCMDLHQSSISLNHKEVFISRIYHKSGEITMTHSNLRKQTTESSAEQIFSIARGTSL